MLKRLHIRMSLLVILSLLIISAGIVLSINLMNENRISSDAFEALDLMARNGGRRPGATGAFDRTGAPDPAEGTPPPLPSFSVDNDAQSSGSQDHRSSVPREASPELQANLGNFAAVTIDEEGSVVSYTTDRVDLYTESEIRELASKLLAQKKDRGQLDRRYYTITSRDDGTRLMIILDNRLTGENARQVLLATVIVAACAWVLLSIGAVYLIGRMLMPVEEAFTKQRQFVSDASHELKTPLAIISANAQALILEHGHNEQTDYIMSEVTRADSLVKSLLSLARLDQADQQQLDMKPFDLSQALLSVVLPFESTVFEAGRTLETEIPEGITYTGREDMIKQLAVILLSNALKYSNEHGLIRLTLGTHANKRVLTVFNTGDGIAPENRERVFDRFWREDDSHSSSIPGQGLGLAIAKSIVDQHKGRITAGGEWHRNAVFTVVL